MVNAVLIAFLMIFLIGLASLVGIFFLSLSEKTLDNILFALVAFATGVILASAILDLIPEAIHHMEELIAEGVSIDEMTVFLFVLLGFVAFFVLERFIYWFHGHAHLHEKGADTPLAACIEDIEAYGSKSELHEGAFDRENPKIKTYAILNLVGDGFHNFLDGVVIMVAFLTSIPSGIAVTLAVVFHELPQEVGDFAVLISGGFSKKRALAFNFASAMVAMGGGIFALFLSGALEQFNLFMLAFSGGGFIYLAAVELMPELLKEKKMKKSVLQAIIFVAGLVLIWILLESLPHA